MNLTQQDLDAIRGIVKEEVQGEIKKAIDELTDKMDHRFAALALRVNQIDERLERALERELA